MKKSAVMFANGFEEIEAISIVDILRRANCDCDMVGLNALEIKGAHGIMVKCDTTLSTSLKEYDMLILPGGYQGALNLKNHHELIKLIQTMHKNNKYLAAICAAPIVLQEAGILKNKNYTAYPGFEKELNDGKFLEDLVVIDENIITSRGPATVFNFAYTLVDLLNKDAEDLKEGMLYNLIFKKQDNCQN